MNSVPESDWKKFRAMKDELLDTACARVLKKIKALIEDGHEENHTTYLKLWKTIKQEDLKIADMFDNPKRSNAILKITALVTHGLIDENTLEAFSKETRKRVRDFIEIRK